MITYMSFIRPLSVIVFFIVSDNLCEVKFSKIKFALWIAAGYVITGIAIIFSQILGSIILLALIAAMHYFDGNKLMSGVMCALLTMIIMITCNTLSGMILCRLFEGVDFHASVADDLVLFLSLIVSNFIFAFILSKILGYFLHKKIKIKSLGRVSKEIVVVFFIVTLMVFFFVYITALLGSTREQPAIIVIYLVFLAFLMILTYFVRRTTLKEIKLVSNERELKQLEEYTKNIESMYNNIRSIRHDYANVISSMTGYLDDEDMEGLKKYFEDKIVPFAGRMEKADNNLAALSKLKQSSVKGIAAVKLIKAQQSSIQIMVDIKDDICINSIDQLDLSRVLGILLDNAYEAAIECEKPYINLGFIKSDGTITIVIVNCIIDTQLNIKDIFNQGYSTKGEDRGYGLSNVLVILEKYPNVLIDTIIEGNEFKQIIYIDERGEKKQC